MGKLWVAGTFLAVLTLTVLLYYRGVQLARRTFNVPQPQDSGGVSPDRDVWGPLQRWGAAVESAMHQRVHARQRTWEIVTESCRNRFDLDRMAEHFRKMARAATQEEFSSGFGLRVFYLSAISVLHLSTYVYAMRTVGVHVPAAREVASGWPAVVPLVLSSIMAILVIRLTRYNPKRIVFALSFIGSILCLAGIWGRDPGVYLGWLSLFTGATLILLAANASIVAFASALVQQRLWTYRATDVHAFADVQMALRWLDNDDALLDLAVCRRVTRLLDSAAGCLEGGLYRALSLQNGPSSLVVRSRLEGAARRLRGYQTWIALPNPGTHRDLQRELSEFLAVLCIREYDSLPWTPPPEGALPRGLQKAISTLRTLLVAVAPLSLIEGLKLVGIVDGGPVLQGLLLLSGIWMLAGIFTAFDPVLGPHLSAFKDLADAVRSFRSNDK